MLNKINGIIKKPEKAVLWANWKGYLNWLPDKIYLNIMYKSRMKKRLNLKNPKTFNEKLQWLKIYDRHPNYIQMVDKYEAKQYVAEKNRIRLYYPYIWGVEFFR